MTIVMPKFNVNAEVDVTDQRAEAAAVKVDYLQPGNHDVTVSAIEWTGPAKDPTWFKLKVTLIGAGGQTSPTILIPTSTLQYTPVGKKPTLLPLVNLQNFFKGLSVDASTKNIYRLCDELFAKEKVLNKPMNITIGYQNNYAKFIAEGEWQLVSKDGVPVVDDLGESPTHPNKQAVKSYAIAEGKPMQEYSEILGYTPKEVEVSQDAEKDANF